MNSLSRAPLRQATRQIVHGIPIAVWRRLLPKRAVGLCYHIVSDVPLPHLKHYAPLSVAEFEADLMLLRDSFDVVSYDTLRARMASPAAPRDNAVVLTFDDGFAECATVIAPMLLRDGLSGIFFVVTDLVDNAGIYHESEASLCIEAALGTPVDRLDEIVAALGLAEKLTAVSDVAAFRAHHLPGALAGCDLDQVDARLPLIEWLLDMPPSELLGEVSKRLGVDARAYLRDVRPYLSMAQIRWLQTNGFTIGAHSRSHRRLQQLSRAEAEAEIVDSCRAVRDLTGQASVPFAFPYSGEGLDRGWLAELRRRHDFIGLYFDTGGLVEENSSIVHRVFGDRYGEDRTLDGILRRAWARRDAWRRRA